MSTFTIFILSVVNFIALIWLLLFVLRRTARQFFFARRMQIGKLVEQSAELLESAKVRFEKSADLLKKLPEEISSRQKIVALNTEKECGLIMDEARERAARIKENAARLAKEDRVRALKQVRSLVLIRAFGKALFSLKQRMSDDMQKRALERGYADFGSLLAKSNDANAARSPRPI